MTFKIIEKAKDPAISKSTVVVTWLKYCQYGVKHYSINQSRLNMNIYEAHGKVYNNVGFYVGTLRNGQNP